MKVRRRLVAALMSMSLVVAACGSDEADDGGGTDESSESSDSGDETTSTDGDTGGDESSDESTAPSEGSDGATATGDGDPNAIFRMSYTVGPSRWDAHRASSSFDNTSLFLTYDRLVHLDADANPVPGLASEWEFNEDGTVLTMMLREGVTFHDGEPFNAEAVKANLERGKTIEQSAVAAELELIESIEVIDEYTVELTLTSSGASLPLVFSDRPGIMISPAAFENPDLDQQPVGAGMFTVTDYQPGASITYEAYPDYWDPDAVKVAGVEFLVQADSTTRLNAIRSGQVDWTFVDPTEYDAAESAGLEILPSSTLSFYHLQLNRGNPPLDDANVRKAINHAIDRQGIIDGLLFGQGVQSHQPFPEGYFGYNEEVGSDFFEYDVELARELMAEAGVDGFDMEVVIPAISYYTPIAEAVQAQLAEIGINVELRIVPGEQVADVIYVEQEADAAIVPWGGRSDPSQTLYLLYSDEGFSNPGRHTTPEVMSAFADTLQVGTLEERAEAVQATVAAITDAALEVGLYFQITPVVTNGRVLNYEPFTSGKPEFRGVAVAPE